MSKQTGTVRHTHQYFKRADGLWACSGIEGCSHYMPKNMHPAPVGRNSICWKCEGTFMLTPDNMRNEKPMCEECSDRMSVLDSYLEQKLGKIESMGPMERMRFIAEQRRKKLEDVVKPIEEDKPEVEDV